MLRIEMVSRRPTARRRCCGGSACEVAAGEVVTLGGRNGAGKTTLLRCVMGLHPLRSGRVDVRRHATSPRLPPHRRARLGLGWVPDDRGELRDACRWRRT